MSELKCLKCGETNESDSELCQVCGTELIKGEKYDKKLEELRDYDEYKKRAINIIGSAVMMLILYFGVQWFIKIIYPYLGAGTVTEFLLNHGALTLVIIVVIAVVLPLFVKTMKIRRKHKWTSAKINILEKQLKFFSKEIVSEDTHGETPKK
jgi:uncharacterized membrane protein (DUF485 family)